MNIRVPILLVLKMLKETDNIYELPSEDTIFNNPGNIRIY